MVDGARDVLYPAWVAARSDTVKAVLVGSRMVNEVLVPDIHCSLIALFSDILSSAVRSNS